jgi:hypothetical protein
MCKSRMRRLIIFSGVLVFLLGAVLGLHAQTYTAYPLRESSGRLLNLLSGDDSDLLADGNGNLHILWSEGGYFYYGRVVYNAASHEYRVTGKEFTNVIAAKDDVSRQFTQPRVAVRRDGQTVHFVWGYTLKHAWRNPQGLWSKETMRTISGVQKCRAPSVVVEDNETVHVLYGYYNRSNGYDPTHLIYQRKPAGGSWSGYMEFDVAGYNQGAEWRNPVLTLDAQGGIHATWSNQIYWTTADGGAARYRYAPAGGRLEAATTVIIPRANGVVMDGVGNIFVDPFGKVHRTICSSLSSIDYTSKPSGAGGAWVMPSRPSIGFLRTPEDSWAGLTTDSCGRVLVAFADGATMGDYPNLFLSVLDQGVWTKYTISTSAGLTFYRQPSLVSAGGKLFLMWRENSGQMYLATTPDGCGLLSLDSPNGGESWTAGESRDIIWASTGAVGRVDIDYSTNSGATWISIARSTANDGLHPWTVPNTPANTCLLRVRENDGSPTGISRSVFSIIGSGGETVSTPTAPTGPATGLLSTSYSFSTGGATTSLGHPVRYMFNWGDGTNSVWLAAGTKTASHVWSAAGAYNVRAMAECATHSDIKSPWSATHVFTIANRLTLTSPNGFERWMLSKIKNITWNPGSYRGTVSLILYKGTDKVGNIATGISAAVGSYAWTVGQYIGGKALSGTTYRITIRSTDNTLVDSSDGSFSILNPSLLQVTAPNGGENWARGSTRAITWLAGTFKDKVKLSLYNKAAKIGEIATNIPATQGTYQWKVGASSSGTAPVGSWYSIRVEDLDRTQSDYSDGTFAITN